MAAPATLQKVFDALKELQPRGLFKPEDETAANNELLAIATALARVNDPVETVLAALLLQRPELIDRWEALLRLSNRPDLNSTERYSRIEGALRRRIGYDKKRLGEALAVLLDCDPSDLIWIEQMRADIDTMTTQMETPGDLLPVGADSWLRILHWPWPGVVDDTGVRLTVDVTVADAIDLEVELLHASGVVWRPWSYTESSVDLVLAAEERDLFKGLVARGPWTLRVRDPIGASGAATINSWSLRISNDVDSSSIYTGFVVRPIALGLTTDIEPAQRLLTFAGVANVRASVCERTELLFDDARSRLDREPIGH